MDAKHTPGPWRAYLPENNRTVAAVHAGPEMDAGVVADCRTGHYGWWTNRANAERIAACVNACEGINPEAVPALLESLMAVMRICDRNTPVFAAAREAIVKATGIKLGECEPCRKTVPVYELTRVIAAGGIETFACDECRGIQD